MDGYDARSIGRRVAAYRRAAGMTAGELAEAVGNGLTRAAVAKLENGYRKDVSTELLVNLAWALKVPPLVLLLPLENRRAIITVGGVVDSMENLGYWIEGLPIANSEIGRASTLGNAIHAQYRHLVINALNLVNDISTQVVERGSLSADDELALSRRADQSVDAIHTARSMLDVLQRSLGLDDG